MPITTFATLVTTAAPKFSGIVGADCMGLGTASGGALDDNRTLDPAVAATVTPLPDGGFLTIVFENKAEKALQNMHTKNEHNFDSGKPPVPDLTPYRLLGPHRCCGSGQNHEWAGESCGNSPWRNKAWLSEGATPTSRMSTDSTSLSCAVAMVLRLPAVTTISGYRGSPALRKTAKGLVYTLSERMGLRLQAPSGSSPARTKPTPTPITTKPTPIANASLEPWCAQSAKTNLKESSFDDRQLNKED
ncbi:hypothetical protein QC764_306155 [Podospora pseudoanserina]|uniref:Uncharacterized protein n=1 Tax=Podospora pseudoanserina TaxID=2609844 RepID=A0ABR0IDS0_9PEZI|nr:hypothetical protein QC764_306155 [Podospora pseudoanserina]